MGQVSIAKNLKRTSVRIDGKTGVILEKGEGRKITDKKKKIDTTPKLRTLR
jgi:hypothetical protein